MNIKKELAFLKHISLGLFNKKYVRFELKTRPTREGRMIDISLRDNRYTKVGNNIDLQISYQTNKDEVFVKRDMFGGGKNVPRKEAVSYIKSLLLEQKQEYGSVYTRYNDTINFYDILEKLSDKIFVSQDYFEMNVWRGTTIYLHEKLGAKFNSMKEEIHINGGVGTAANRNTLRGITTIIEFAKNPADETYYLGVFGNIVEHPKRPAGLYPNATTDIVVETLLEQYQSAWNRDGQEKIV